MPFRYRPPFEPAPFQSLKFLAVVRERRRLNPGKNPSFLLLVEVGLALVAYARSLPRTRFTLAALRPPVDRGGRLRHHETGVGYSAVTQAPEMHGPLMYFTPDWPSARQSVLNLAALGPDTVVTGHGQAMQGPEMRSALGELAERFDEVAVPKHGQYVP